MAIIDNDLIRLLITEEEMDTLIQALGVWRGPFLNGANLTTEELYYKERRLELAGQIGMVLENEAMRRYHEKEAQR